MAKPRCKFCRDTGYLRECNRPIPCVRCDAYARARTRDHFKIKHTLKKFWKETGSKQVKAARKAGEKRQKKLQSIDREIAKQ